MVIDPIFWLGLSILLVAVSLTAVLMVAIPAFRELGRAARSAEKLFDTLNRELPPTLEAIRLTGLEITELTDDMSQGVQSAGQVAKQVDQTVTSAKQQVQKAQTTTRSLFAGVKAAWRTLNQSSPTKPRANRLPPTTRNPVDLSEPRRNSQNSNSSGYVSYSEDLSELGDSPRVTRRDPDEIYDEVSQIHELENGQSRDASDRSTAPKVAKQRSDHKPTRGEIDS
jgi:FtsZ-binding cell division protein ZapB